MDGVAPLLRSLALTAGEIAGAARLPVERVRAIMEGAPADLCLFDPERVWKVDAGSLPGKAQNTPFDGRALEGRVLGTWKAGRRVFG